MTQVAFSPLPPLLSSPPIVLIKYDFLLILLWQLTKKYQGFSARRFTHALNFELALPPGAIKIFVQTPFVDTWNEFLPMLGYSPHSQGLLTQREHRSTQS